MIKIFAVVGAIMGGLAVTSGAFGAHALEARLDERALEIWDTAARYQMFHALALLAVAFVAARVDHLSTTVSGVAFITGIVIFSGSLYLLAMTGVRWLGAITPIGGVAFIVGWIALAVAAAKLG